MLGEVIIRAVGDAPEFAPAEGEQELNIAGRLGIERELRRIVIAEAQFLVL